MHPFPVWYFHIRREGGGVGGLDSHQPLRQNLGQGSAKFAK